MSRLCSLAALVLVSVFSLTHADPPRPPEVLKEIWEAGHINDSKVGWLHSLFCEVDVREQRVVEAATEIELNLLRFKQSVRVQFAMANHETTDGQMLAFAIRQTLGKDQDIVRTGKRDGNEMRLNSRLGNKPATEKRIEYHPKALGLYGEEQFFVGRELKPNTKLHYVRFDPTFNAFLTVHVELKDWEPVTLLDAKKYRLLRVEKRPEKALDIELAPEILWVDEKGEIRKRQIELPGIGDLIAYRTTKKIAEALVEGPPIDVGVSQLVRLHRPIPNHQRIREATFRVRIKGADAAAKLFPADDRQEIRNPKGDRFELVVRPSVPAAQANRPADDPPPEYLKSNAFVTSDDERVKAHAKRAVGDERDPWRKALRVESWVKANVKGGVFSEALASAAEVAKSLEGDCTEHAMLAAAMCRASGIPARTAVGLVYSARDQALVFHMWFEVWIDGRWIPLDGTLGLGRLTATHVKILDAHWNDAPAFTALLPLNRVLGKLEIEVVETKPEK